MLHLKIGDQAPDFNVPDENGTIHNLNQYKGKKLVLYFYPKASTPGCTAEACNLRDNYDALLNRGFEVLGVSADEQPKLQNFITKQNLPFHLLSDVDKKMLNDYGVWGPKKFMGKEYDGIHRTTFIIDEAGIITDIITKVKTKDHYSQIK
ncbi:thioredoxin-dependent thiol peroxidase [Flavobacterium agricola]|uniref:thioredoxin-dependent peroxiredoxin n=1 Tax=Flavobacterium agricola TaxID=2870839 RepID=A0ABY6M2I9_9FLAO|nr:thioredoxin-dependent thiol peroxidase [Flavobacterium agricola]UYW01118.1 thioredoxin-dependent thiol peroxidase [Flavobacterium agricola]